MKNPSRPFRWQAVVGIGAIVLFIAIYGIELLPHHGPPATVIWIRQTFGQAGLIIINIAIVISFLALFTYRRPSRGVWSSKGVFVAFVIALMTEMFGWPLIIFLISPFFNVPVLAPEFFQKIGHWPATVGTALSILGLMLIALGWYRIHAATGLVTDGIYRWMRHPQYSGIFLFTLGWILHWPSLITLILWPVLGVAYYYLARYEEKQVAEEFGEAYQEYARKTRRFIPYLF